MFSTCDTEKDLGVYFYETSHFHSHIYTSISKAKSSFAWLLTSMISRNSHEMKTTYRSLVRHNLEYYKNITKIGYDHFDGT